MNPLDLLVSQLEKEKKSLSEAIARAKHIRDTAPSAMESHSDTTRSEYEKLAQALETKLAGIIADLRVVSKARSAPADTPLWTVVTHTGKKFLLVPDGFGGRRLDDIFLLSVTSPLGRQLSGRHPS